MRLGPLFLFAGVAGVVAFHTYAPFREAVRGWNASKSEQKELDAYHLGKRHFRAAWPSNAGAKYAAWGDVGVGAKPLTDEVWKVRGIVTITKAGTRVTHPWVILFDPEENTPIAAKVGPAADREIRDYEDKVLEAARQGVPPPVSTTAPPPPTGIERVLKDYRNPLEQKPKR